MGHKRRGLGPHRTHWWWAWGATTVGIVLLTIGPFFAAIALGNLDDTRSPYVLSTSIVAFLSGLVISIVERVHNDREAKRGPANLTKFNDRLSGIVDAVDDLVQSRRDKEARERFFRIVVGQASGLFPIDGVRVCVYELEAKEPDDANSDPEEYLRLIHASGRADEPRSEFRAGTKHGDAAIALARGTAHVCVDDYAKSNHPIDRSDNAIWQSFFALPLREDHKPLGMLAVDTRVRTVFTEDDLAVAQTIARFLVIGIGSLNSEAVNTDREVRRAERGIAGATVPSTTMKYK